MRTINKFSSGHMHDPHRDQPVTQFGPAVEKAAAVLILLHGRGASAQSMEPLYNALNLTRMTGLAPQAANHSWYPQSFLAPLNQNQPWLDSALGKIESLVTNLLSRGVQSQRIALLGFSQGACLASEFVARYPRHYGGLMALTGGLIGPPGTPRDDTGTLNGMRVFLGAGDPDMHVPFSRVVETRDTLINLGATVELRRYADMPHTINSDEINVCRVLLESAISSGSTLTQHS